MSHISIRDAYQFFTLRTPPSRPSHLRWTLRLYVLSWDWAAGRHAGRDRDHEWQLLSLLAAHGRMCSHSKLQTPHSPAELRQSLGLRSRLPRPLHHQMACPVPHVSLSLRAHSICKEHSSQQVCTCIPRYEHLVQYIPIASI